MKIFNYKELPKEVYTAIDNIKEARALTSKAKKLDESGKDCLKRFIKDTRDFDIGTMQIGDKLVISGPVNVNSQEIKNDLICIEIGSQEKFDQKSFQIANGVLFEQYKKPSPITNYKF